MKIAIFGGSFDPVHTEHVRAAQASISALSLDKVLIVPSYLAPHKHGGAHVSGEDRLAMCRLAFAGMQKAEVSDYEIKKGGTSYTYLTCRRFRECYPNDELYFLVGADMLEDFFTWKNPEDILKSVTLCAFGRGGEGVTALHERFQKRFGVDFTEVPHCGKDVSSTELRVKLYFGQSPEELPCGVLDYIRERGLYFHPAIAPALALESEKRRAHSLRVALLAARRARSLNIPEEKAVLAAALHDCGKNLPSDSEFLRGFTPPDGNVPMPVLHQYTGAFLCEHVFGINDEEVLDAICYHTSGREDMTTLGKLIFLSDMLESGRDFEGIESLRKAFWNDLDECLLLCMEHQIAYLEKDDNAEKNIYPLTKRAYNFIKNRKT